MTRPLSLALRVIRENRRAYATLNLVFYGLVVCAMVLVAFHPELQQMLNVSIGKGVQTSLPGVVHAYRSGNILSAAGWTFFVNSIGGAFVSITLPSMIVPFFGLLMTGIRMILWGLLLSPTSHTLRIVMIPHSLTLVIEGQAYILAAFGSYLLGKWGLFPRTAGMKTHLEGYIAGLKANLAFYSIILPILAFAALYEASEVVVLRHFIG